MAYTHFHALLRARISQEVKRIEIELARGAATDHGEYKLLVGKVLGMEECLNTCDEIEREFDERSNSAPSS